MRDFLDAAFRHVGLEWQKYVKFDPRYLRPTEVDALVGDASFARDRLGWSPTVGVSELARLMVEADLAASMDGPGWIDAVALDSWPLG